jgi:hypothetical protein
MSLRYKLESEIFNIVVAIAHNEVIRNKNMYKLTLLSLESLNEEYRKLYGDYYIDKNKILRYYEKVWEIQWIK